MSAVKNKGRTLLLSDDDTVYKTMCLEFECSRTLDDFYRRIHKRVKTLGFTDFIFLRLERCWQAGSQKGLLSSLPSSWLQCYQERKLYEVDLLLSYAKCNDEPIFSSHIYSYIDNATFNLPLTHNNRRVLQLYKHLGYSDHYVIPMSAYNGHGHVLLLLTCVDVDPQELQTKVTRVRHACWTLCRAIDSVSTLKFRSSFVQGCDQPLGITHHQLRILRYLANEDYTIKDLAERLCISPITAHQHIAAARKALHVNTNIRAVVKAIKAGLITIY